MKHLIKKENNIIHGTLGWSHNGKDGQYCEAGETVKIKWQPTAGWGLKEVHYTDGDGNVVAIEGGEFVMPDSAVVIGATFKRFFLSDWAETPYNPKPQPKYLTFTAGAGGANVGVWYYSDSVTVIDAGKQIEFSTDGITWQHYEIKNADNDETPTMIALDNGKSVMFRGVNPSGLSFYVEEEGGYEWLAFVIDGDIVASGDITSLINGVGGDVVINNNDFRGMFQGCTGLTEAPALPATTLADSCYYSMFQGCTGLTEAPALPATTLAQGCYNAMFQGCTGLTTAPSLPATTLADYCYNAMFQGCTAITSHDVATLNQADEVFADNSSCTSLIIHADTPPTIGSNTISGLKADCIIYVPAASVDAYKAAQYWSARAAYIQAIQ